MVPVESENRVFLDLPILYPNGTYAIVDIEKNSENVWVSDMGRGLREAELMAIDNFYHPAAREKARDFGVKYDNNCIFALQIPIKYLESAIISVSNASVQAAAEAFRTASEAKSREEQDRVFDRISSIFGPGRVHKSLKLDGACSPWTVYNLVEGDNGKGAIFEPMSNHAFSISSKYQKFNDLRETESSLSLNVVVNDSNNLDPRAQMLSQCGTIIEFKAHREEYQRLLAA